MYRAVTLVGLLLLLAHPAESAPCRFEDVGLPPLRFQDRLVIYQRQLRCPGEVEGSLTIKLETILSAERHIVTTEKKTVRANARWARPIRLVAKGFRSNYCHLADRATKAGRRPETLEGVRIVGVGSRQQVVFRVPIEATLTGEGGLEALTETHRGFAECSLCPRPSGRVDFKNGRSVASRIDAQTKLVIRMDAAFFRCVQPYSSLSLRFFSAPDKGALLRQFRPVLVLDELEKKLKARPSGQGREEVGIDMAPPLRALCRRVEPGHVHAWELAGRGPLMAVGGGGRRPMTLVCP